MHSEKSAISSLIKISDSIVGVIDKAVSFEEDQLAESPEDSKSGSEVMDSESNSNVRLMGTDINHNAGSVDWEAVQSTGINWVYCKVSGGYSNKNSTYEDPNFATYWSELKKVSIARGGYCFFDLNSDGKKQAELFLKIINEAGGMQADDLTPCLDIEWSPSPSNTPFPDSDSWKDQALAWLTHVEKETRRIPVIYTGLSMAQNKFDSRFSKYPLWVARYPSSETITPTKNPYPTEIPTELGPWDKWMIWQYSQSGKIDGIGTGQDLDIMDGSLESFIRSTQKQSIASSNSHRVQPVLDPDSRERSSESVDTLLEGTKSIKVKQSTGKMKKLLLGAASLPVIAGIYFNSIVTDSENQGDGRTKSIGQNEKTTENSAAVKHFPHKDLLKPKPKLAPKAVTKSLLATVGNVSVYETSPFQASIFTSALNIDADGSPFAYHPNDGSGIGLDFLANAGHPGNWWGIATHSGKDSGDPVIQGASDPAPGYYVSTTALVNPDYNHTDPRAYVDASTIPFIVLPRNEHLGGGLGDIGAVVNFENGKVAYVIAADIGPDNQLGEGSIALAKEIGVNANPKNGGVSSGIGYCFFPESGSRNPKTLDEINQIGEKLFSEFGGVEQLEKMLGMRQSKDTEKNLSLARAEEKTLMSKVGSISVYETSPYKAAIFKGALNVDADGSPIAYHPDDGSGKGLDYLANAGHPGNWWGIATDSGNDSGNPVIQGPSDPAPGYYVSTTALVNPSYNHIDPRAYVNASTIPFIVLPSNNHLGGALGDIGAVVNFENGKVAYVIAADIGPANQLGEGSVALAEAIGVNANAKNGGTSSGVGYCFFPDSGSRRPKTLSEINSIGEKLFSEFGGVPQLKKLLGVD